MYRPLAPCTYLGHGAALHLHVEGVGAFAVHVPLPEVIVVIHLLSLVGKGELVHPAREPRVIREEGVDGLLSPIMRPEVSDIPVTRVTAVTHQNGGDDSDKNDSVIHIRIITLLQTEGKCTEKPLQFFRYIFGRCA